MMFRYLGAVIYDWVIALTLLLVFTAICLLATKSTVIAPGTHWYQISLVVNLLLYYLFSLRYGGQTIGMRAFRLKIVAKSSRLGVLQIIARLVLTVPAGISACFLFSNTQNRLYCWTKTRLIHLAPNQA